MPVKVNGRSPGNAEHSVSVGQIVHSKTLSESRIVSIPSSVAKWETNRRREVKRLGRFL